MKTTWKNNQFNQFLPWIVVVLFILLMWLLEFTAIIDPVKNAVSLMSNYPRSIAVNTVNVVFWPIELIKKTHNSARRIQDLESRLSESLAELGQMEALEQENQALREVLTNSDIKLNSAIISFPIVSYGRSLVAVGFEDGVSSGAPVLIKKTLVGRVTKLESHQAEVELLSSSRQPILAKTEDGLTGIVIGTGKNIVLTEVPSDAEISIGQRVLTAGQEGVKADLFIGKIVDIKNDPAAPTQEAVVEQLVSFYEAKVVEIEI